MRIEHHPKLNVLVREDGAVYLPATKGHFPRWTFGSKNNRGYLHVMINGKLYKVHRLVAETFIPNPENLPEVDHINRNREDNRVSPACKCNLRWCSHSENSRNRRSSDRIDSRGGTHKYENTKQYQREQDARRRKTHKKVLFPDGRQQWIPNEQATGLLKLPVKERVYGK